MPFPILRKLLGLFATANPVDDVAFTVLAPVIENALAQHGQVVAARAAPTVADPPTQPSANVIADTTVAVQNAVTDNGMAIVPVKSGLFSKISWVQLAGPAASLLAVFGLNLSSDQIVGVVVGFQTIQAVITWVMRQWFTKSVTASSVKQG